MIPRFMMIMTLDVNMMVVLNCTLKGLQNLFLKHQDQDWDNKLVAISWKHICVLVEPDNIKCNATRYWLRQWLWSLSNICICICICDCICIAFGIKCNATRCWLRQWLWSPSRKLVFSPGPGFCLHPSTDQPGQILQGVFLRFINKYFSHSLMYISLILWKLQGGFFNWPPP